MEPVKEEKQKAFAKLQNSFFPTDDPDKINSIFSLIAPIEADSLTPVAQFIFGDELDQRENKRFLKTISNKDKVNFRSPFSPYSFPDNVRTHLSPAVQHLETLLNSFLDHYVRVYYAKAFYSGFVHETKDFPVFYIGISKENTENYQSFKCKYAYKIFTQIKISRKDTIYKVTCNAHLKYELDLDLVVLNESMNFSGTLNNTQTKPFNFAVVPSPEDLLEIVGYIFEKADSSLRNNLASNVLKLHEKKLTEVVQGLPEISSEKAALVDELKKLPTVYTDDRMDRFPKLRR